MEIHIPINIDISHRLANTDDPSPGIAVVLVTWGPWPVLCSHRSTEDAFSLGIQYVGMMLKIAVRKHQLNLAAPDLAKIDSRIDAGAARAQPQNSSIPDSSSRITRIHAGALAALAQMDFHFGSEKLRRKLAEVVRCLEMGVHHQFVRLMDYVLREGAPEEEALEKFVWYWDDGGPMLGRLRLRV
jgi:hypothetical protein